MTELDKILKENSTVARINNTLISICKDIPDVAAQCEAIIIKYLPIALNLLASMSPQDVCSYVDLCTSSVSQNRASHVKKLSAKSGILCEACEFGIQELQKLMNDSSIQEKIEDGVEEICNILPGDLKTQCNSLVEQYLPQVFSMLEDLDASQICAFAGLCSSTSADILKARAFAGHWRV